VIGVLLLILAAAGVGKALSGDDPNSDNDNDLDYHDEGYYTSQLHDSPQFGSQTSHAYSGTYSRQYRFDKETGRFEED